MFLVLVTTRLELGGYNFGYIPSLFIHYTNIVQINSLQVLKPERIHFLVLC